MNIQEIQSRYNLTANTSAMVNSIISKKGQFTHIKYMRPLKFRKEFESNNYGFKEVTGVFRLGAEYENLQSTKEKREGGVSISGLNGRNWAVYPYLLESKANNISKLLVRVYAAKNTKSETKYFINGKPASPELLDEMCLKSELSTGSNDKPMFDINLEYIKEVY